MSARADLVRKQLCREHQEKAPQAVMSACLELEARTSICSICQAAVGKW
jgi:hypothetical protein